MILNKKKIRKNFRFLRHKLSVKKKITYTMQFTEKTLHFLLKKKAKKIALFISIDNEINTYFLINKLLKYNKKIYLPTLNSSHPNKLIFVNYTSQMNLKLNKINFFEPSNFTYQCKLKNLDIIILPVVAFDKYGYRLGMGGGFYDRTLQNYKKYSFIRLGIAYDFQYIKFLPRDPWDIPLSYLITPKKIWKWKN